MWLAIFVGGRGVSDPATDTMPPIGCLDCVTTSMNLYQRIAWAHPAFGIGMPLLRPAVIGPGGGQQRAQHQPVRAKMVWRMLHTVGQSKNEG